MSVSATPSTFQDGQIGRRGDSAADAAVSLITEQLLTGGNPCVTSSFQAQGVVLVHMIKALYPDIPVLFVDTLHHFDETLAYRDDLVRRWKLNLVTLRAPAPTPGLWRTSTTACCARHKIQPLFDALESFDVWFTALRREQSPTRAHLSPIEPFRLPSGKVLRKVSPLAGWRTKAVWEYAKQHDIPLLPLYAQGYTSIGCEPCTSLPLDPSNLRSGRWAGQKLECGIHVPVDE